MNKVCLVGRLARNPELRKTPNDTSVARFTLAVSKNYINKDGEREADFINCISWKNQADNLVNIVKKGHYYQLKEDYQLEVMMPKMALKNMLPK